MANSMGSWISHQLSEFLARVTSYPDQASALRGAIEHAGEAFEAEVVAIIEGREVVLSIGLCEHDRTEGLLAEAAETGTASVTLGSIGFCRLAVAELEDGVGTRMVVARAGDDRFGPDEQSLLINMGRTLGLVLRMLRTMSGERAALQHLMERQRLMDRLAKVRGSISHRAPLQEVLDAITKGARELLGDESAAIRLIDPDEPRSLLLMSSSGFDAATQERVRRVPVGIGAAGRAIKQRSLVVMENYPEASDAIPELSHDFLQSAIAVPLFSDGAVVGSLVSATFRAGRAYSDLEQEMLRALGEHAGIALTDARTLESMREAQKAKDIFLTMVSHELKTPLTVIMGTLQTLKRSLSELPEHLRDELLASAVRRGEDLRRLIDMLLQATQADLAGARRQIAMPTLVAEGIRDFDTGRLHVTPPPDATIWADAGAVRQIVGIFLENALAHSPERTPIDVVSSITPSHVTISVRNHGSLPEDVDVETLFSAFERGPDARSSGVGMGLYIASSLARSIDGHLDASSEGGYVEFTLVFPFEAVPDHPTDGMPRESHPSPAHS